MNKLGTKENPYPVGTQSGEPNAFYLKSDGKEVGQFSNEGKKKGRVSGSSNLYGVPLAEIATLPKLGESPKKTGDPAQDALLRKTHSINLGKVILAAIAGGITATTGGTPSTTTTRLRTDEELEAMATEAKVKGMALIKFALENREVIETVPAIPGKQATLLAFAKESPNAILPVNAGEVARWREVASMAVMDAVRAWDQD